MELINGDQPAIEGLNAELIDGEAERRMGANEHLVIATFEERADRVNLAAIVRSGRVAKVPLRGATVQSAQKPNLG